MAMAIKPMLIVKLMAVLDNIVGDSPPKHQATDQPADDYSVWIYPRSWVSEQTYRVWKHARTSSISKPHHEVVVKPTTLRS